MHRSLCTRRLRRPAPCRRPELQVCWHSAQRLWQLPARRALGIAVFSGMLGVTLFGILLTPVFYPDLLQYRSLVVDLVYEEYCVREEIGDVPEPEVDHEVPVDRPGGEGW